MTALAASGLSYAPPGAGEILRDITLRAGPGEVLGILGPNGAGKSTLLRLFYGAARPSRGVASIDGVDVHRLSAPKRARLVAAVPQESPPDFNLTVRDIVETGRTAYVTTLLGRDPDGPGAVARAVEYLALESLVNRSYSTLSGGEKRRALIARALAQDAKALVLDEPVNHLDIRHKLEVMSIVRGLGATVMVALHDFDLAVQFCDRLAVLHQGALVASGSPEAVLLPSLVEEVFGVTTTISRDEASGSLRVLAHAPTTPADRRKD